MTTELFFTILTALLAASLWIPYIVGVNTTEFEGGDQPFHRPPDQSNMLPWIHRAYRAHQNLLEQFLPFAVLVLIGQSLGVTSWWFGLLAGIFFGLRVIHAFIMTLNLMANPFRPIVFTTCWAITMAYGIILLVLANGTAA
ncbi:MAG: MAPEG family protein [Pseudomonadota bacterium]